MDVFGLIGWVHRGYLILSDGIFAQGREHLYSSGDSQLRLVPGDITTSQADVIVSSDDYRLAMSGGVSAAIASAAGNSVRLDAAKKAPAKLGHVIVTSAGSLPAQYIFHAIVTEPGVPEISPEEVVKSTTQRSLELLDGFELESISFPVIGSGAAQVDFEDVVVWMVEVLRADFDNRIRAISVSLYIWPRSADPEDAEYSTVVASLNELLLPTTAVNQPLPPAERAVDVRKRAPAPSGQAERRHVLTGLGELQREQEQIEPALATASEDSIHELRRRLNSVVDQRVELARRERALPEPGVEVFISYAREDRNYRVALGKSLAVLELSGQIRIFHDQMIDAGADWDNAIQNQLATADVILLLLSPDFLASKYIDSVEMTQAKKRYDNGEVRVIPILIRHSTWDLTWLKALNAVPADDAGLRPVSAWTDSDQAYTVITKAIDGTISALISNG